MATTIQIDENVRKELEKLKIHRREPLNEVILRLLEEPAERVRPNDVEAVKKLAIPILKRNGVKKAAIFGSFARGEANEDSDIDLLVKYKESTSLFDAVDLKNELEAALGRKVDLVSYDFIDKYIRERVLKERLILYG